MAHLRSTQAESDLDEILFYVAKASGRLEIADRLVDAIVDRFVLLARYPHIGRARDLDLRPV
jgi:plasmid stabilization system protein ParE